MLLIVAAFLTYNSDWFQKKYIYPYPYQSPIERYAKTYGVDPLLIVSIMKAESKFDPQASSEVGAVGLMQLMPDSGLWIAGEIGEPIDRDLLKNPEVSIKLGSWYIASLIDENDGNLVLALAAYNAGRGNVYTWVKEKKWPSNFNNCDSIPFKETRAFVKKVLGNYDNYKKLYRNEKQL
jgi:soluble lytic murein transglycosylase